MCCTKEPLLHSCHSTIHPRAIQPAIPISYTHTTVFSIRTARCRGVFLGDLILVCQPGYDDGRMRLGGEELEKLDRERRSRLGLLRHGFVHYEALALRCVPGPSPVPYDGVSIRYRGFERPTRKGVLTPPPGSGSGPGSSGNRAQQVFSGDMGLISYAA